MPGVFEIHVKTHFSAARSLEGYPGVCARIHGHTWIVEVYVRCEKLNEIGLGIDMGVIKKATRKVLINLDHSNLNELPEFEGVNPTSENIAKYLYQALKRKLNTDGVQVSKVKVSETPGAGASYWEE